LGGDLVTGATTVVELGEWSTGELVRAITSLTRAMEIASSVPREVYDRDMTAMRERHTASSTWLRELTAPVITALMSGVILWFLLGGHR
jgi:hypothetical protein